MHLWVRGRLWYFLLCSHRKVWQFLPYFWRGNTSYHKSMNSKNSQLCTRPRSHDICSLHSCSMVSVRINWWWRFSIFSLFYALSYCENYFLFCLYFPSKLYSAGSILGEIDGSRESPPQIVFLCFGTLLFSI